MVLGPALVTLPVHAGRPSVKHLHAVCADVPYAGLRIFRDDERERDVSPAVVGPAPQDGQFIQRAVTADHFLARGAPNDLRYQIAEATDRREQLEGIHQPRRSVRLDQFCNLVGQVIEGSDAQGHTHPFHRSEHVRGHRDAMPGGTLKEESRTAPGRLARAVGHGAHFQIGANLVAHPGEQPLRVERRQEVV